MIFKSRISGFIVFYVNSYSHIYSFMFPDVLWRERDIASSPSPKSSTGYICKIKNCQWFLPPKASGNTDILQQGRHRLTLHRYTKNYLLKQLSLWELLTILASHRTFQTLYEINYKSYIIMQLATNYASSLVHFTLMPQHH